MLSAARIVQYNVCATGRTVQGSNSVTGKRSLYQGVCRVAVGVSWTVRLRTRIHLVPTLRMCGAIHSTPPIFLRGLHMDYEDGDTKVQVTGQLNFVKCGT